MNKKHISILSIVILSVTMLLNANAQSSNDKESARIFVQKFYDWYVPLYNKDLPGKKGPSAFDLAIKHAEYFDVALRNALIEDTRAQSKVSGDIIGLDSDPFLNAQDVGFSYQAGDVNQNRNNFLVDVHYDFIGKSRKVILASDIAIIAEVAKIGGSWKFINFLYTKKDGGGNLLSVLAKLKKDRIEWAKQSTPKKKG